MKWLWRISCAMACAYSVVRCVTFLTNSHNRGLLDGVVTLVEIEFAVNCVVIVVVLALVVTSLQSNRGLKDNRPLQFTTSIVTKWEACVLVLLSLWPRHWQAPPQLNTRSELPARSVVDPAVMVWVLHRILQRRREQIEKREMPGRLSEDLTNQLYHFKNQCVDVSTAFVMEPNPAIVEREAENLLGSSHYEREKTTVQMWDAVVRMYGFPMVQNSSGTSAQFGKSRSVEVLAWLAMNSDRARRSAVRTAVWDIDISDSSFSTVMSDVRRGLNTIAPSSPERPWMPPTFTDEIHIGQALTSDYDLLRDAYEKFLIDASDVRPLATELSLIRDIPFAGTNYLWADLDGTTTRMVVLAVNASRELGRWAKENNDVDTFLLAVRAGLRVLPGCEELLDLQQSFISESGMSPRRKIAG